MINRKTRIGWKLLRERRDGTLGPLFINRRQRIPTGLWLQAEDHPTRGFAHRPGWRVCAQPVAPHLSKRGRVWAKVLINDFTVLDRPVRQGGRWFLAQSMYIVPGSVYQA